ncbi:hypothetical protein EVA_16740 [gut metagenome]|uniref:Uncharacterized protein n=1 Tax=gut metagenome TaxID=749906 RepID=J9G6N5_9ZZZZ
MDKRSKNAYRFIGESPLVEDGRNLLRVYRLHLISGAVKSRMMFD